MAAEERNLLFGLIALRNGLVDRGRHMAAFRAWTADGDRSLGEHLVAGGDLDDDSRVTVEALVGRLAEAEPLLTEGYEGMRAREPRMPVPDSPRLLEAAVRVARSIERRGPTGRSDAWKRAHGLTDLPDDVFTPTR